MYRKKRSSLLLEDLEQLLGELCVDWGFCNKLRPTDLFLRGGRLSADHFAESVLRAEGIAPDYSKWLGPVRQRFIDRYGDSITADEYEA